MYLSFLLIDLANNPDRPRPARQWARRPYRMHQRLCMAFPSQKRRKDDPEYLQPWVPDDFPLQHHVADQTTASGQVGSAALKQVHRPRDEEHGFLYRMDSQTGGRAVILVQSASKPDWGYAFANAKHFLAAPPEVKPIELSAQTGQRYRFRLRANPTRKVPSKTNPKNGRRVAVYKDEDLRQWLDSKGDQNGFRIELDSLTIRPEGTRRDASKSKDHPLVHYAVVFGGTLDVQDAEKFVKARIQGIGSAKAMGFGLLSVAPLAK